MSNYNLEILETNPRFLFSFNDIIDLFKGRGLSDCHEYNIGLYQNLTTEQYNEIIYLNRNSHRHNSWFNEGIMCNPNTPYKTLIKINKGAYKIDQDNIYYMMSTNTYKQYMFSEPNFDNKKDLLTDCLNRYNGIINEYYVERLDMWIINNKLLTQKEYSFNNI